MFCNAKQTNKHVVSNCGSVAALARYAERHNTILSILADWLKSCAKDPSSIFADIVVSGILPILTLFRSLRPDIAIVHSKTIEILKSTVCHENNFFHSRDYKRKKYANLKSNLNDYFKHFDIIIKFFRNKSCRVLN